MAHNLEFRNGRYSMFLAGKREDAWHKLGQRVNGAVTWEDAIRLAQLDWTVSKVQLSIASESGVAMVPAWGIVRDTDQSYLGTVGEGFTVKQNAECFAFVDDLLQANGGSHYDSAGALGNGATIWCSVRIPKADFSIAGDDAHESYLTFTTAHDGSMAHTAAISTVRVVCQNTLRQALSTASGMLRIKHTKNADSRFQDAKRTMEGVVMDSRALAEKLKMLSARKMTRETMTSILDRLFPKPKEKDASTTRRDNVLEEVMSLYESNDKNAIPAIRGTAYNLLNAVTEWTDHYRSARITDSRADYSVDKARAENAVLGTGERLKTQALDVILQDTAGNPVHQVITSRVPAPSSGSLLDAVLSNHQ
jgi:phage/plasmid-like protein (TIGR03299 family)